MPATITANEVLLAKVRSRKGGGPFGYGITTADRYVRTLEECVGIDACYKFAATRNSSFEDVKRRAAQTLVYGAEDARVESVLYERQPNASVKKVEDVELPKNTLMVFRHVLTTPRKDRDGDVLRTEGAEVDPKMLLLWQHVHTLPIGKMLAKAEHNANRLVLISAIVDMNELCHDAAVMVDNDMARFSHGFRALEFDEIKEGEGQTTAPGGFDVRRFEIMEESIVSVPSNADAEVEDVLLSLVDGGKLTSGLMKAVGREIRNKRPTTSGGVKYKERAGDYEREIAAPNAAVFEEVFITVKGGDNDSEKGGKAKPAAGGRCTCASAKTDGAGHKEQSETQGPENAEVKMLHGPLQGSWEYIETCLSPQIARYLDLHGVDMTNRRGWLCGTFDGYAIVCSEYERPGVDDEFLFYRISWELVDGKPRFTGEPEPVEIVTTVELVERSPLYKLKHAGQKEIRQTARTPSYSGTETTRWSAPTLRQFIEGYNKNAGGDVDPGTQVADLPAAAKRWIASKTLLGNQNADTFADLSFFPVVNPDTDNLNANALRAVLSGRGSQADIPQGAKDSAQAKARSLLDSEFREDRSIVDGEKVGRTISRQTMEVLRNVRDDLIEIKNMDSVPRAAKALADRCTKAIEGLIGDEGGEMETSTDVSVKDAMVAVLTCATAEERARLADALHALQVAEETERRAKQYRAFVGAG